MNIFILIYFSLYLIGLGYSISIHGKEKKGKENAYISFFASMTCLFLLYMAGCFDAFL